MPAPRGGREPCNAASANLARVSSRFRGVGEPDDDVYSRDLGALWWLRQPDHVELIAGNVHQGAVALEEEMIVVARVRIEVGLRSVDRDFAQQAGVCELIERVVDGCQ